MKFLLTIDTEGDNQWDHGRELTLENIKFIPRFQELCRKYKIRPTYLVTSEVCADSFSKELFCSYARSNEAEIGAHLHSWTTQPFGNGPGMRFNDPYHIFATELSESTLDEKIKNLTGEIENAFEMRPSSFRSGRYGFNEKVAEFLCDNNYIVDSSVTPYTDWSNYKGLPEGQGGPNFMQNNAFPFKYTFDSKTLIEIPITILPTKFPLNKNEKLSRFYFRNVDNNLLLKILRKLIFHNQPLWLRPFLSSKLSSFDELIKEAENIKLPFLVMMFHSSELMPGCSIYRSTENDIEQLYEFLDLFFKILESKNITSLTLTQAAKNYTQ